MKDYKDTDQHQREYFAKALNVVVRPHLVNAQQQALNEQVGETDGNESQRQKQECAVDRRQARPVNKKNSTQGRDQTREDDNRQSIPDESGQMRSVFCNKVDVRGVQAKIAELRADRSQSCGHRVEPTTGGAEAPIRAVANVTNITRRRVP